MKDISWSDIARAPEYSGLDDANKAKVQQSWFDANIKPTLPSEVDARPIKAQLFGNEYRPTAEEHALTQYEQTPEYADEQTRKKNMETRGEFTRGLYSGIDQVQGLLYGSAGLIGDAIGSKKIAEWGFKNYQRNMHEASLNPLTQESFTEAWKDKSTLDEWFVGTIGRLTPSVGEAVLSGLIGQAVAPMPAVGAAAGVVNKGLIKKYVNHKLGQAISQLAAKGVAKEALEVQAKRLVKKDLGAAVGIVLGTAALESGGMWTEVAEKHGIEKANPLTATMFGLASGTTELVSPGGTWIRKSLGISAPMKQITRENAKKILQRGMSKQFGISLAKAVPSAMAKEGLQETTQELLTVLNTFVNTGEPVLTKENITRFADAGAAGAAGGVLFGAAGGTVQAARAKRDAARSMHLDKINALEKMPYPVKIARLRGTNPEALKYIKETGANEAFGLSEADMDYVISRADKDATVIKTLEQEIAAETDPARKVALFTSLRDNMTKRVIAEERARAASMRPEILVKEAVGNIQQAKSSEEITAALATLQSMSEHDEVDVTPFKDVVAKAARQRLRVLEKLAAEQETKTSTEVEVEVETEEGPVTEAEVEAEKPSWIRDLIEEVNPEAKKREPIVEYKNGKKAESDTSKIAESDTSKIAESDTSKIAESDTSKIAESDTSKIAESDTSKVAESDTSKVAESDTSKVAESDTSKIAESDTAKVAESDTSKVAESDTSKVAESDTSKVAESDTSKIAESDTSKVAESDTSRVAESDTSKIAESDTSEVPVEVANDDVVDMFPSLQEAYENYGTNIRTSTVIIDGVPQTIVLRNEDGSAPAFIEEQEKIQRVETEEQKAARERNEKRLDEAEAEAFERLSESEAKRKEDGEFGSAYTRAKNKRLADVRLKRRDDRLEVQKVKEGLPLVEETPKETPKDMPVAEPSPAKQLTAAELKEQQDRQELKKLKRAQAKINKRVKEKAAADLAAAEARGAKRRAESSAERRARITAEAEANKKAMRPKKTGKEPVIVKKEEEEYNKLSYKERAQKLIQERKTLADVPKQEQVKKAEEKRHAEQSETDKAAYAEKLAKDEADAKAVARAAKLAGPKQRSEEKKEAVEAAKLLDVERKAIIKRVSNSRKPIPVKNTAKARLPFGRNAYIDVAKHQKQLIDDGILEVVDGKLAVVKAPIFGTLEEREAHKAEKEKDAQPKADSKKEPGVTKKRPETFKEKADAAIQKQKQTKADAMVTESEHLTEAQALAEREAKKEAEREATVEESVGTKGLDAVREEEEQQAKVAKEAAAKADAKAKKAEEEEEEKRKADALAAARATRLAKFKKERGELAKQPKVIEKVEKPAVKKAEKPIVEKVEKPADKKAEKPIVEKVEKPADKKAEKPIVEKVEKPADKKAEKPIVEKVEMPADKKAEKPVVEKVEKPADPSIVEVFDYMDEAYEAYGTQANITKELVNGKVKVLVRRNEDGTAPARKTDKKIDIAAERVKLQQRIKDRKAAEQAKILAVERAKVPEDDALDTEIQKQKSATLEEVLSKLSDVSIAVLHALKEKPYIKATDPLLVRGHQIKPGKMIEALKQLGLVKTSTNNRRLQRAPHELKPIEDGWIIRGPKYEAVRNTLPDLITETRPIYELQKLEPQRELIEINALAPQDKHSEYLSELSEKERAVLKRIARAQKPIKSTGTTKAVNKGTFFPVRDYVQPLVNKGVFLVNKSGYIELTEKGKEYSTFVTDQAVSTPMAGLIADFKKIEAEIKAEPSVTKGELTVNAIENYPSLAGREAFQRILEAEDGYSENGESFFEYPGHGTQTISEETFDELENAGFIYEKDGYWYANEVVEPLKTSLDNEIDMRGKKKVDTNALRRQLIGTQVRDFLRSKGLHETETGTTREDAVKKITAFLGLPSLPDNIRVVETQAEIPAEALTALRTTAEARDLSGVTHNGVSYIIAANSANPVDTLVHEASHIAIRSDKTFAENYYKALNALNMKESPGLKEAYRRAVAEQKIRGFENDETLAEETLAYYLQGQIKETKQPPFIKRIFSLVKQWFFRRYGLQPFKLTSEDLIQIVLRIATENTKAEQAAFAAPIFAVHDKVYRPNTPLFKEPGETISFENSFRDVINTMAERQYDYTIQEYRELEAAKAGKVIDHTTKAAQLLQRILGVDPREYTDAKVALNRQNSSWSLRLLSSPEYMFTHNSTANRVLTYGLNADNKKYRWQNDILGDESLPDSFVPFVSKIKKRDKASYVEANDYLIDVDATGKGFSLKEVQNKWAVLTPGRNILKRFEKESDARDFMISAESKMLKEQGFSDNAIALVAKFRGVTNRIFDLLAADWRMQIETARRYGFEEPTAVLLNDEGKQERVNLSTLVAQTGDLRGTYFPRERPTGHYKLIAKRGTEEKILEIYDMYWRPNVTDSALKATIKAGMHKYATKMTRKKKALEAQGYTVTIKPVRKIADDVFDAPGLLTAVESVLMEATKGSEDTDTATAKVLQKVYNTLASNIENIYKKKGTLSSRVRRSKEHWLGYETDMLTVAINSAQKAAAGVARRETARDMLLAFTGRDVSLEAYLRTHPGRELKDYEKFVRDRAISAVEQPMLYKDVRDYMTYVLKPTTPLGKAIGFLGALAVLKYLGGRVSSAAINLSNMVVAVPATINAHTKVGYPAVFKHLTNASTEYAKYRGNLMKRSGLLKGPEVTVDPAYLEVFDTISRRGWDAAQFNMEAFKSLQSTWSNSFNGLMAKSMWLYGEVEKVNRALTIAAAYMAYKEHNQREGFSLNYEQVLSLAKHSSDRAHGVYGKMTKPWIVQKYEILNLPYTFQKFTHNYLLNMHEIGFKLNRPQDLAYMLISPAVLAGAGATLLTPMIAGLAANLPGLDIEDPEEEFYAWVREHWGDDSLPDRFARHGLVGLANINFKGSIQPTMPMPTSSKDLLGAPGGVMQDLVEFYEAFKKKQYLKATEYALPSALGSPIKGLRERYEGVTTPGYQPLYYGTKPVKLSVAETALRVFSFNPARVSGIRETQWREKLVVIKYQRKRSEIQQRINQLLTTPSRDSSAEFADVMDSVRRYNEQATALPSRYRVPLITDKWLRNAYKTAVRIPKHERLRTNRED